MKKLLLALIISSTTGIAVAKSTDGNANAQSVTNNYLLQKSTSGLTIIRSDKEASTRAYCDNPSSGCYTGFIGSCYFNFGEVVYCIQK